MAIVQVCRRWDDSFGDCYDCGDPAAYIVPDLYQRADKSPIKPTDMSGANLFCAVCAALHASEGERIIYLWMEEDVDDPTDEQRAYIEAAKKLTQKED